MTDEKRQRLRENNKRYYQKNKEKILARQRKYVRKKYHTDEEFRKKTLDNHKRYEENNKERVKRIKREAQKKYYQKHKEYYHNYSKQWSKDKINNLENKIKKLEDTFNEIKKYIEDTERDGYKLVWLHLNNTYFEASIKEILDKEK